MQKGFTSRFLIVLVLAITVFIVISFANLMTAYGVKTGQYSNPNVASSVVNGTVYDRKGTALAVYTNELVFPLYSHGYNLINEVCTVFENELNPKPEYDQAITYGKNIYLALDAELQNQLDQAVSDLVTRQRAKEAIAIIANASNGDVLACSSYPFVEPGSETPINNSFVSEIEYMGKRIKFSYISRIKDYRGNTVQEGETLDFSKMGFSENFNQATDIRLLADNYILWVWTDKKSTIGINQFSTTIENILNSLSKI